MCLVLSSHWNILPNMSFYKYTNNHIFHSYECIGMELSACLSHNVVAVCYKNLKVLAWKTLSKWKSEHGARQWHSDREQVKKRSKTAAPLKWCTRHNKNIFSPVLRSTFLCEKAAETERQTSVAETNEASQFTFVYACMYVNILASVVHTVRLSCVYMEKLALNKTKLRRVMLLLPFLFASHGFNS